MRRMRDALPEWRELRSRVYEERRFHFERAVEDLIELGASAGEAKRAARRRIGSHHSLRLALREIGGDLRGLIRLLRVHGVFASPWLQPVALAAICMVAGISVGSHDSSRPASSEVIHHVLFLATDGPFPKAVGEEDFHVLQSMAELKRVERYRDVLARAETAPGLTLEDLRDEVQKQTGQRLRVKDLDGNEEPSVLTFLVLWLVVLGFAATSLRTQTRGYLAIYGLSVLALHAAASLLAWVYVAGVWEWIKPEASISGDVIYAALVALFFAGGALQYSWVRRDLARRCPECLERLVLPFTHGETGSIVLNPETTESICSRGHGALIESRLFRRFAPESASIESLFRGL